MSITLFAKNQEQLKSIAKQILDHTSSHRNFAFYGKLMIW